MNVYVNECRSNPYGANAMKKKNQAHVHLGVLKADRQGKLKRIDKYPIKLKIAWYEPDNRRDVDNITFAVKFILDELVSAGIIKDDSRKYVSAIENVVLTDRNDPRIEVEIIEGESN